MTTQDRINHYFGKLNRPTRRALRRAFDKCNLTIAELEHCLPPPSINPYARHLLFTSTEVALLVVNWTPEQECAPHDHGPSTYGWVRVLEGTATHIVYTLDHGRPIRRKCMLKSAGQVFFAPRGLIHSMGNPGKGRLVTLHAYSPAIQGMRVYDPERCRSCIARPGCGAWWPADPVMEIGLTRLLEQPG